MGPSVQLSNKHTTHLFNFKRDRPTFYHRNPGARLLSHWDFLHIKRPPLDTQYATQNWLVVGPPLWKIWVRQLGWLDIPNINGKIKNWWQPNHQPDSYIIVKPLTIVFVEPTNWIAMNPHMEGFHPEKNHQKLFDIARQLVEAKARQLWCQHLAEPRLSSVLSKGGFLQIILQSINHKTNRTTILINTIYIYY